MIWTLNIFLIVFTCQLKQKLWFQLKRFENLRPKRFTHFIGMTWAVSCTRKTAGQQEHKLFAVDTNFF